jgi:hypothetical protein
VNILRNILNIILAIMFIASLFYLHLLQILKEYHNPTERLLKYAIVCVSGFFPVIFFTLFKANLGNKNKYTIRILYLILAISLLFFLNLFIKNDGYSNIINNYKWLIIFFPLLYTITIDIKDKKKSIIILIILISVSIPIILIYLYLLLGGISGHLLF